MSSPGGFRLIVATLLNLVRIVFAIAGELVAFALGKFVRVMASAGLP